MQDGATALWLAAKGGHEGVVRQLLAVGANPHDRPLVSGAVMLKRWHVRMQD